MNTININGKTYNAPDGCSVSVVNNKVYFNGKLAEDFNDWKEKNIEIKIEGNCGEIKNDVGNVTINGNVEGNVTVNTGNVTCKNNIQGNAKTDCGKISAHHIFGNTNVDCGIIDKHKPYNFKTKDPDLKWFSNFFKGIFG